MPYNWSQPSEVSVAIIIEEPRYQIRVALDEETISQYESLWRRDVSFPPINLARLTGTNDLYVIDGWHRLEAARRAGKRTIAAQIARMSDQQALAFTVTANTRHGLRLKREDVRRVFDTYIAAQQHLVRGERKSLREIESDLGGIVSHVTVGTWLRELALPSTEHVVSRRPDRDRTLSIRVRAVLTELSSIYSELNSFERGDVIRDVRRMLESFERARDPEPEFGPDI